jgi:hypothetical protein
LSGLAEKAHGETSETAMRPSPLLLVPLLLAGCAAPRAEGPTRDQQWLSRELAGRVAGPPQTCVPAESNSAALTIVDDRTLAYQRGRTLWVNNLEAPCPGLRPFETLIVEVHGSQYCRNDRFRSVEPGLTIPGPYCLLGDFTPYRRR